MLEASTLESVESQLGPPKTSQTTTDTPYLNEMDSFLNGQDMIDWVCTDNPRKPGGLLHKCYVTCVHRRLYADEPSNTFRQNAWELFMKNSRGESQGA